MLTGLTVTAPVWAVAAIFALFGAGFGMANAPITTAAVSGMPTDRPGAAAAVTSTSRQIGVICGSWAESALTASGAKYAEDAGPLWLLCAALGMVITVLAVVSTSGLALRSAERLVPPMTEPAIP